MPQPQLTLHVLPPSPPCLTVIAALGHKNLAFETVSLTPGRHTEEVERIYGAGHTTVPGLLVDGEPVHGSRAILARLEEIAPEQPLFPEPIADAVREAERWGDVEFQDLGRRLPWGALHFRPEAMGTFGGGQPLDAAGTDFAMKYIHATWKYHKLSAQRLYDDLQGLPEKLAHIESLAEQGILGADTPNAADFQVGPVLRIMLTIGDVAPLLAGSAGERIARRWFPDYPGHIPAGAYPAGWVVS